MIKRPLHVGFKQAVLEDIKVTTIRENPWPVGVPIMLYHWEGKAYRSAHIDVAVIEVLHFQGLRIHHREDGRMSYLYSDPIKKALWISEGFESQAAMDEWFCKVVRRGTQQFRYLMTFRRHPSFLGMPYGDGPIPPGHRQGRSERSPILDETQR